MLRTPGTPGVPEHTYPAAGLAWIRLPAAVSAAAILTATMAALAPELAAFPLERSPSWAALPIVFFVVGYALASTVVAAWIAVDAVLLLVRERTAAPPWVAPPAITAETTAPASAATTRAAHVVAAAALAAIVLVEGVLHFGGASGSWATSVPRVESDLRTADGAVFWLDGQPTQSDSGSFVRDLDVLTGRAARETSTALSLPGRAAYTFWVGLLGRVIAPLAGTYAVFLTVNMLFWWGGAVAVYDLARRARDSWWAGLFAGALVATGLGFTFSAGNAMSNTAAYGVVAMVLWLLARLQVFAHEGRWSDLILVGCVTGSAGLFYSTAPLFLGFAFFYYIGRGSARRLLVWAMTVIAVGDLWSRLSWPASIANATTLGAATVSLLPALLCVLSVAAGAWIPRRRLQRGLGAVAVAGITAAAIASMSGVGLTTVLGAAMRGLQVPTYLNAALRRVYLGAETVSLPTWSEAHEALRVSFDGNVTAAFPVLFWPLALLGFVRLPREWRDWSVALAVSGGLLALAMIYVTSAPHPRLVFFAYPAVYLLAASGLLNVYQGVTTVLAGTLRDRPLLPVRAARVVGVVVACVCLLLLVVPSNASLWGDLTYDLRFHFVS